jgi:hypothetical protein
VVLGLAAEAMGAFSSSTKKSTEELERQKQATEDGKKAMELYYRSLAAFGLDEIKINERKIAQYKNELQAREMMMQTIKGQNAEINGMNQQQLQNRITELKTLVKETENANKEIRKGRSEQIKSSTKERNQEGNQIIDFVKETNLLLYENQLDAQAAAEQAVIDGMRREGQARASAAARTIQIEDAKAEEIKRIEQAVADFKEQVTFDSLTAISQTLAAFGNENKGLAIAALAIEKGSAIANVIINLQKEMSANAAMAFANPANALTGGAVGIAQTKALNTMAKIRAGLRIASITAAGIQAGKTIMGGGESGGAPSPGGPMPMGAGGAAAPPIFANPNTTDLSSFGNGQGQGMQPMRAYVVERDIQQTTSRVRRLSEFATLG